MFLGMQAFDFCPNLIKFYSIYPNLLKFYPNLHKKLLGDAAASLATARKRNAT